MKSPPESPNSVLRIPRRKPLQELLALETAGDDVFVATLPAFGAFTLGCAALAAGRTCDGRALHSLHSYFIRPVPLDRAVRFVVERVRDGRRFALRRIKVMDEDRLLFEMSASFASPGDGPEHQDARIDSVPPPDTLADEDQIGREEGWTPDDPSPLWGPFEFRWPEIPWRMANAGGPSRWQAWVRPRSPLPRDRALNAAAIAYLSDYHSHMSVARKLGSYFEPFGYVSLDEVIWLHRDLHWEGWRLLVTECDVASAGRALTKRMLYTPDGLLVASMAQEQLIPTAAPS